MQQTTYFSFVLYMFVVCSSSVLSYSNHSLALIISYDGFRWNYLDKVQTPNFDHIKKLGVHARRGIKNVFPTKTLPNHHTMVTGLYPESHGIIGNVMFDPVFNEAFHNTKDPKWFIQGGDPLWVMNQRKDPTRRSGGLYWPATDIKINGMFPYKYATPEPRWSNETMVDMLIDWFTSNDDPINFALAHFVDCDRIGHSIGPETPEMAQTVARLDKLTGYLLDKFRKAGLLDKIDIIFTGDHGMRATPIEKLIDLDKYIDPSLYKMFGNLISGVLPNEGKLEEIYNKLKNISHLHVLYKEDIPERFHYKYNRRVMPLLLMPDEGYSMTHNKSKEPKADHGYDNEFSDMHPFFLAMGPSFKQGYSVESFDMINIYALLCHILNLDPAPNNGSLDSVRELLRENSTDNSVFLTYTSIILLAATISGVYSVAVCRQRRYQRFQKYNTLPMSSSSLRSPVENSKPDDTGGQEPLLAESKNSDTEEEF